MVEVRYDHTRESKEVEIFEKVSQTIHNIAHTLNCGNKDCKEKQLAVLIGSNVLAMQGLTLRHVCHEEYLNTINANLPDWLQIQADSDFFLDA